MHIVTLSFDDGFIRSDRQVAEIYERYGLAACFNVIATGHQPDFLPPDDYHVGYPKRDFAFWNELQGFDPAKAVFNVPYNASTPELEAWLPSVVRAFRTGGPGLNPLPHPSQVKLTCAGFGPENCEADLDRHVEELLAAPAGWLIYNTHGLEDEGWGPIGANYLDNPIGRMAKTESVRMLPAGQALALAAKQDAR